MPKEDNLPLTLKHFQTFEKTLDKRFYETREEFKEDLNEGLEDLAKIFSKEIRRVDGRVNQLERKFDQKFNKLINTLDDYIKKVEAWHEDSRVLAARLERVQRILIEKGIATEKELSL